MAKLGLDWMERPQSCMHHHKLNLYVCVACTSAGVHVLGCHWRTGYSMGCSECRYFRTRMSASQRKAACVVGWVCVARTSDGSFVARCGVRRTDAQPRPRKVTWGESAVNCVIT